MFPSVFFVEMFMSLTTRFIVGTIDSPGAVVGTVALEGVIEIFMRQTLASRDKILMRWKRGVSAAEADRIFNEPIYREYLASVQLAKTASEYVAIPVAAGILYALGGNNPSSPNRVIFKVFAGLRPGETLGGDFMLASGVMLVTEFAVDMLCFNVEILHRE